MEQQALFGIMGGMGPLATVDFLNKLTRLTPASCDQEHLPWLTISQPGIPDRSLAIQNNDDAPARFLTKGVAYLAERGVKLIAIPCNTSHYWYDQMQAVSSVPILHIADATIEELRLSGAEIGKIAVLATRGTVKAGIYSKRLEPEGFDMVRLEAEEQAMVDAVIHGVKKGSLGDAQADMHKLLETLAMRGVKTVILGCTELPIAQQGLPTKMLMVDTSLSLAKVSLRRLGFLDKETA